MSMMGSMMASMSSSSSAATTTSTTSSRSTAVLTSPSTSSSSSAQTSSGTASGASSSTASLGPFTTNAVCPAADGATYVDANGIGYAIHCSSDSNGGAFSSSSAPNGLRDCFVACDAATNCAGFTFSAYADGTGICYAKHSVGTLISAASNIAVGVRIGPMSAPSGSAATSGSASSSRTSSMPSSTASSSSARPTTSSSVISSVTPSSSSSAVAAATSSTSASPASSASPSATGPLYLTSPVACNFGDPPGTIEDDSYCEIDLPFTMVMYSSNDTKSYASTNGFLSILSGSSQYQPQALPDPNIPSSTACPFFDDLCLFPALGQGIFYQLDAANTSITYEFYLGRAGLPNDLYHFLLHYSTAAPGVFTYAYYAVGNGGATASVGIQGVAAQGGAQVAVQYSFQRASLTPGLVLTCDTNAGTCVSS
ncbi:hypothetical protein LTR50_003805 [Elasticomyces elasticus]|nr:hypothetical protein LTR50_003805 [Elasticomyces elasticus]